MDNTEILRACRVCLATDVKLVVLYPGPLAETYEQLTGMQVLPTDGLPQHLCSLCVALLKKSAAFIKKCRDTQAFLQQGFKPLQPFGDVLNKVEITMSSIRNLDKGYFKLPYITTNTLAVSVPEDIIDGNFDQYEVPVKIEIETDHEIKENKLDCILNEPVDDFYDSMLDEEPIEQPAEIKEEILADVNVIKPDPIFVSSEPVPKIKKEVKVSPDKSEKIKKRLIKCKVETDDNFKQLFCDYVLHKYFYKTKESSTDDYDMFVSDAGTVVRTVDELKRVVFIENGNVPDAAEGTKLLYDYIKNKYVEKKEAAEVRKIVDVVRLKVKKTKQKKTRKSKDLGEFGKTYNFEIIYMTKVEQILELERARKKTSLFHKSSFICSDCFRGFKTETALNNHKAHAHDPSTGSHVCDVCKLRFTSAYKMKKHALIHKTKFICRQCQQIFKSTSLAREHYKSHVGVRYDCEHCGATFRKYGSRVNHIRIHHGATVCDICYEGFQGASGVNLHKTRAHKKTYQCATCGVHFDNAGAMRRHLGAAGGACDPTIRACAKCGELFPSDEQFNSHVARLHAKTRLKPQNPKKKSKLSPCCTCLRSQHGKGVPSGAPCPCGEGGDACLCPRGSLRGCKLADRSCPTNDTVFSRRKWAHVGCCRVKSILKKTQIMCEMCASIFQTEAAMKLHQRVHTGEKPFQCNECPSRFRTKSLLEMHTRTHTGDRPVKCQLCPKAFKTRAAYYRHQLVHTKERRFSCEVCGKMFLTSTCVKTHVKTVHMKIPQPPRVRSRKRKAE